MDLAYFHLWSAGYLLPATTPIPADKPAPVIAPKRKRQRAKRGKAVK